MNITKKNLAVGFILLAIIAIGGSYFRSFSECKNDIGKKIDAVFKKEASLWGDRILHTKGIPYIGRYNSREYANKKKTTMINDGDTIEISTFFYHPNSYNEYQLKNLETHLLTHDEFDINFADSLFKTLMAELGIIAESSVELKVRDLHQMFPTVDSMCVDAPFVKTFSSGSIEGHITPPVGVGICNHALLYGHVKIPISAVLANIELFGTPQMVAVVLLIVVFFLSHYGAVFFPHYLKFRKDVVFIGNTCIDLYQKELYLWSGECRHITDTRMALLQMLLESAPAYKLSKEDVCLKIWKRNAKDGQALYNVVMTDMRTLFITEDPSLELKSLPREGMQLLVNDSLVKRGRWLHFLFFYMAVNSKRMKANE